MPKSPKHILRDTLERLDIDLSALMPAEKCDFLDKLPTEIEERLIELADEGETGESPGLTSTPLDSGLAPLDQINRPSELRGKTNEQPER